MKLIGKQGVRKCYHGENHWLRRRNIVYVRTGEYRAPKAGEYYLSGAIPTVYLAPNDLSHPYHIAEPVRVRREEVWVEVE